MKQIYCKEGTLCSKYPLEEKKIIKKSIGTCIVLFFIVIWIGIIIWPIFSVPRGLKPVVGIVSPMVGIVSAFTMFLFLLFILAIIFVLALVYEMFYYKFYFYDITEKELVIRKGVIATREVTIPFSRIQDVYIDQDILDRFFGLYDVHVATAATGGYRYGGSERAHIDGVNFENAQALKKIFIEKIRKEEITKTGI